MHGGDTWSETDISSFSQIWPAESSTSTLVSTSTFDDSSIYTTDDSRVAAQWTFDSIPSMPPLSETVHSTSSETATSSPPTLYMAAKSPNVEGKVALPKFLQRNVPMPVKYTFKPLHKTLAEAPSQPIQTRQNNTMFRILPKAYPQRMHTQTKKCTIDGKFRQTSALSALSNNASTEPPTLNAVKRAVDGIDPRFVLNIAHTPPAAMSAVALFRRKRESNESHASSSTEYYQDDYTKFIEKKPISPPRLLSHPYFSKLIGHDGWALKSSRMDFSTNSTMSVSTSDEEYTPFSHVTRCSDA